MTADQTVSKDLLLAITQARNAKGLSQKQLATQLNMQPQVINEYESGKADEASRLLKAYEELEEYLVRASRCARVWRVCNSSARRVCWERGHGAPRVLRLLIPVVRVFPILLS